MNIHFTDKTLKEQLIQSTILETEVGSGMYGMKNENSDTDILFVYLDGIINPNLFQTNHQLQYNENNTNYIFTSLQQFVRNILSGDNTINYEVLVSEKNKGRKYFDELYNIINKYNINVIKSYLGLAKRDLKELKKNYSGKKMFHFIRGVEFAYSLANDENIFSILENKERLLKIKNSDEINEDIRETMALYESSMNTLRAVVNSTKINIDYKDIISINNIIKDITNDNYYKKQNNLDIDNLFIKAIFNNEFNY